MRSALISILLCGITAVAASTADIPTAAIAPEYRIGVEDVLDVAVWNVAELQKTVPVRPDGKISLPLVNDVVAAGLTPMELRDHLAKKISVYVRDANVSVVVREIHSLKVSVLGQVREPGRYDLRGPASVLDALALAGGFTDFAARRKITIIRPSGGTLQHIRFDYDAAVSKNNTKQVLVQPGDVVVVP